MNLYENGEDSRESTHEELDIETAEILSAALENGAAAKKAKKKNSHRRLLIVVCAVVLAIAALLIAYALWERPPELPAPAVPTETAAPAKDAPQETTDPVSDPTAPEDPVETPDPGEAPLVEMSSDRKDGFYTMLLVGRDFASNSTDTILVGSFDTVNHKISCVSIPRDTLINIKWAGTPKKINAVYPGYVNSGEDGMAGLCSQIKNLLGFDVDCYALVTLEVVEQAVDAIGGVWFDVPQDMLYIDPLQNLTISIPKGYQLLDGENALKLCRFRHTYAGGDLDRIKVQQDFLKATASQMLTLGNIPNLGTLIDILTENVETNLTAANMAWFARQFLSCDMDDISFETLPYSSAPVINGISFVSVDPTRWLTLINEKLNPYKADVTLNNVNILTSNSTGTSANATSGAVAGGPDSFYCLTCTLNNGGKVIYHAPGACPPAVPEPPKEPELSEETPEIEVVTPGDESPEE